MHISSARRPSRIRFFLVVGLALVAVAAIAGLALTLAPVRLEQLAREPDAQIAVFMVPLTLLVLAVLAEATRIVWQGKLPAPAPARRRRSHWAARP
ncbi:hypothetical protein [Devosia sp.]|uniref:hypothetical protein n=1 Tax=Devosia sp. TaxID=1871048 RepID=UPI002AFFB67F|nr:hypothetical protein [Devosia sp.]